MHTFRVWAPRARSIEVQAAGGRVPMQQGEGGWWHADVDGAAAGTDYAFLLDGEEPALPDPRSPWQPHGVHGASRLVDHSAFAWGDAAWQAPPLESATIYELHLGTFTPQGTLDAAIERLEFLRGLGITHVELLPVAAFPGDRGWGYDGVDLFAVHEAYGGPDALKRFVNAAHAQGLAVLLDVVYNHFGPSGNYVARFGPYFTHLHNTPWGDAVNLEDAGSHEVRRFFCDNAKMWLRDYHIDGLRLDAVHAFIDRSAIHFLEQLAGEVRALEAELDRSFVLIAESDLNDPRLVIAPEASGYGLDAAWSDDFHHALIAVLTGETSGYYSDFGGLARLAKALASVFVYDGVYSGYRDRVHGRPVAGLPGWRFVGFSQNHDQVGNRARGERLEHLAGPERAKIAAAMVLTAPFVPLLFQGEEFAASAPFLYFTHHDDPELARAVSDGRRREFAAFGWNPEQVPDPQAGESFAQSKLDWGEAARSPHAGMLDWYRALIRLRRETPALTDGRLDLLRTRFDEAAGWFVMERGPLIVAFNIAKEPRQMSMPARLLLASEPGVTLADRVLTLPPDSLAILQIDPA